MIYCIYLARVGSNLKDLRSALLLGVNNLWIGDRGTYIYFFFVKRVVK